MDVNEQLVKLGINLSDAPASLASYLRTVRFGDVIYVSGQLPLVGGEIIHKGKVGVNVSVGEATEAAKQCAINALAALKSELGDLSRISRIVKLTGFVASSPDFISQPQVVNGASDFLVEVFGEIGKHARSAVGVSSLPLDSPVELELIVGVLGG